MKSFYIIISFFFYSNFLFCQNTFTKNYSFSEKVAATQILYLPGKHLLVTGTQPDECYLNCNSKVWCLKFDNNTNLVLSKEFYASVSLLSPKIISTSDNGVVVACRLYDTSKRAGLGIGVVKCDSDGNIIWSKRIISNSLSDLEPQVAIEDSSGNLIITSILAVSKNIVQILKLKSNGEIIWATAINTRPPGFGFYYPTVIKQGNGGFYIGGELNCQECEGNLRGSMLYITKNGQVVYFKSFAAFIYDYNDNIYVDNITLEKDKIYVSGNQVNYNAFHYYIFPFNENKSSALALYQSPDKFYIQHYLKDKNSILPIVIQGKEYKKDGSFREAFVPYGSNKLYINKYDSLGRICPDYVIPSIDTNSFLKKFRIDDKFYELLTDSVYSKPTVIYNSDMPLQENSVCNGSPDLFKENKKIEPIPEQIFLSPKLDELYKLVE